MIIWVVFDHTFFLQKTPETGGLKICRPRGGTKKYFLSLNIVVKMTAQNTGTQQKKRERPSLPGGRDICKNVSKSGDLVCLGVFG